MADFAPGLPQRRATPNLYTVLLATATLLLATIAALFHHMYLGVQTVIEDYIHDERPRIAWLMVAKGVAWLLGLASAISVLKLAFTG
jgi:succinate dehydrogenase / fumarate reductase membrane anchor subunit